MVHLMQRFKVKSLLSQVTLQSHREHSRTQNEPNVAQLVQFNSLHVSVTCEGVSSGA